MAAGRHGYPLSDSALRQLHELADGQGVALLRRIAPGTRVSQELTGRLADCSAARSGHLEVAVLLNEAPRRTERSGRTPVRAPKRAACSCCSGS